MLSLLSRASVLYRLALLARSRPCFPTHDSSRLLCCPFSLLPLQSLMQSPRKLAPIVGSGHRPPSASHAPPVALHDSDYEESSSSSSSSSDANHSGGSEANDAAEGVVGKPSPRDAVPRPTQGRPVSAGGDHSNGRPTSAGTVQGGMLDEGGSSSSSEDDSSGEEADEVSHSQKHQGGDATHRPDPNQDFPVEFAPPKVASTPPPQQQAESFPTGNSARSSARASLNRVDSEFEYGASPQALDRKASALLGESGGFPASAAHISDAPFNSPARATDPIEVIAADRARSDAERKRLAVAGAARQISLERRSSRSRGNSKNPSQASTPIPSPRGSITGPLAPIHRSPQPRMAAASSPHLSPSTATNFAAFSLAAPATVATATVAVAAAAAAITAAATPAAAVPYVSHPSESPRSDGAGVVIVPPLLSVFLPGLPSMCEVCDERQARVFCLECNQKQCWGVKSSAAGASQGGCCIDVHRHPKRTAHQRWEWTSKGRGRRIEFDPERVTAAVPPMPEAAQALAQKPAPSQPAAAANASGQLSISPVAATAASSPSSSSSGFARSVSIPSATAPSSYSSPSAPVSSSPSSLHPSNWLPSQVCAWLMGVLPSPAVGSCLPSFQRLAVSGAMLLRITDDTLRGELGIADAQTRRMLFTAVESLQRLAASFSSAASLFHSGDTAPPLDLAALMASQGVSAADAVAASADPADPAESFASASVSYTRAQLVFVLGERERLIARLQEENRSLQRRLDTR